MKRLFVFAVFTAFTATSGWAVPTARAADSPATGHERHFAACAKINADCALQCDMCFKYCLTRLADGQKEHAGSARLCADCAECCKLCATLCARQSTLCPAACEFCAKCCDDCAAECDKAANTPEMKACAESCKKCAASCREMSKLVVQK